MLSGGAEGDRTPDLRIANGFYGPLRSLTCSDIWYIYSQRSAISGSTLVARCAGTKHEMKATTINKAATATNVIGSRSVTPNSNDDITLVSANAPASPTMTPINASIIPCRTTSFNTSSGRAQ